MVSDCRASKMNVKTWCNINGVSRAAYYYRQQEVQKALLAGFKANSFAVGEVVQKAVPAKIEFAEIVTDDIVLTSSPTAAITVHLNGMTLELQNGASSELITNTFRALCEMAQ
jgi:hypothetical protein